MSRLKALLRPIYAPILRPLRRRADLEAERGRIRDEILQCQRAGKAVKIIIGAGQTRYPGWIATDMPAFDALNRKHWERLFPPQSLDRVLAEHVFEHLRPDQLGAFLAIAADYLAPGGRIRIAVPDGSHPDPAYIQRVKPGGSGVGADDHKVLYTGESLGKALRDSGYQYRLLEHFDAAGNFQRRAWQAEDGFVQRSAEHDRRNAGGQLNYTSVIVDCWR